MKARRERDLARKTVSRGLQLSSIMALLVGWIFLGGNPVRAAARGELQCESIGLPVGPAALSRMSAAVGRPMSAGAPQRTVSVTVCDPSMAAILNSPEVQAQLKDLKGLGSEYSGLFGKTEDFGSMLSLWKEVVDAAAGDQ